MQMLALKWVNDNGLQARWQKVSAVTQPESTKIRLLARSDANRPRNLQLLKRDVT